jgi:hypothetical protein
VNDEVLPSELYIMYMQQEFAEQYVHDEQLPSDLVSVVAHAIREQLKQAVAKLQRYEDAVLLSTYVCARSSLCVYSYRIFTAYVYMYVCVCMCVCVYVCVCVCVCWLLRMYVCIYVILFFTGAAQECEDLLARER